MQTSCPSDPFTSDSWVVGVTSVQWRIERVNAPGGGLNGPVLDAIASPTGRGYDMVGSDGGIFTFGDAPFFGSLGDRPPPAPVVSVAILDR